MSAKEVCISTKEPQESTKEPCTFVTSSKESSPADAYGCMTWVCTALLFVFIRVVLNYAFFCRQRLLLFLLMLRFRPLSQLPIIMEIVLAKMAHPESFDLPLQRNALGHFVFDCVKQDVIEARQNDVAHSQEKNCSDHTQQIVPTT